MTLANAADENLAVHAAWACSRLPGARVAITSDLVLVDSGQPCDTFNFACRARLGADAGDRVSAALDFFRRTGHPFSWWLGPGATPDHLAEVLVRAGLAAAERELAMGLELARLAAPPAPPGFVVERVRTADQLALLAQLSAANWSPPDPEVMHFYHRASALLLSPESPQWFYLGTLEGRPVATAEVTVGGGVVGLYNVATIPECRGRGIGSVMTSRPLEEARAAGHTQAILQASEAGQNLYARLGFTPFGTITEYKPA
jgi:ribosomal protein S18 acetylase RimI-like enzyme